MRDQYQGRAMLAGLKDQRVHYFGGGGGVQVAGGFVCQQKGRAVNERSCNRHTLQLPTAELLRQAGTQAVQADCIKHALNPRIVVLAQQ